MPVRVRMLMALLMLMLMRMLVGGKLQQEAPHHETVFARELPCVAHERTPHVARALQL